MINKKLLFRCLFASLSLFVFLSRCAINEPPKITMHSWLTENIHPDFWTVVPPDGTALFFIECTVSDPDGTDDITKVIMSSPDSCEWTLKDIDINKNLFDQKGYMYGRFRTLSHPNTIMLGNYRITAVDSEENESSKTFSFGRPGSTTGTGFIYSEEYTGPTTGGTEMIDKAVITGGSKAADSITVEFTIDDTRVFNGLVWLYDSDKSYITWSGFFKDTINGGSGINKSGGTNTLVIREEDLEPGAFTWNDISRCHVVVTDGEQYLPEEYIYEHSSISALLEL
jgi:hypothetical protein